MIEQLHRTTSIKSFAKMTIFNSFIIIPITMLVINQLLVNYQLPSSETTNNNRPKSPVLLVSGHVVLTRDDQGQHLVLSGEDGKKGKGGGDQLVIAGSQMGGDGQDSNMILQDASNREGDIVMSGKSMIIPGEDGHIVLADSRNQNQRRNQPPPMNPMLFWAPYMNNRYLYRMMMMMPGYG
jgi:hypothetical protein